jgi:uncharacterized repeat protein (TIGR01451 family)
MKTSPKGMIFSFGLVFVLVGALVLSGCSTCSTCGTSKPAGGTCGTKKSACGISASNGMLYGTMTNPTRDRSSSVLVVDKSAPEYVRVGVPYDYTITVTNLACFGVEDVVLTEKLNEKLKLSATDPKVSSQDGNVLKWDLGKFAPNESKSVKLTVIPQSAGDLTSCSNVTYKQVLCIAPQAISPELKVGIEAPQQAGLCDTIPVKITVSNTGTGGLSNVVVAQDLPAGLVTADGKSSVSFKAGNLNNGESKSFNLNLKAQKTGSFSNAAKASADGGITSGSNTVSTAVKQAVLKVNQSGPSEIYVGRNAEFKIAVTNVGDASSENTVLKSEIPGGSSFVRASEGGSKSGNNVVWNLGTLKPQQSANVTVVYKGSDQTSLKTVASANAACSDPAQAAANADVKGIAAILLEVVDVNDPIEVGEEENYEIMVTNQGSAPDTGIRVVAKLGEKFDFISAGGATKGTFSEGEVEFAPLPTLGAKQQAKWNVIAKPKAAGENIFTVSLKSDQLKTGVGETEATTSY